MKSPSKCPYCGKEYPTITIPNLRGEGVWTVTSDECGCEGERAERRKREREALQADLTRAWRGTGVPEEYWGVTPDCATAATIDGTSWLYLHGPRGTGKTTRACQCLKGYVRLHQKKGHASARFIDVPTWLASMRRDWGSQEEDAYQRAAGVTVLVLDDLGKGKPTEWAMERVFRLISDRWSHHRATIITSQYDLNALAERCAANGDRETAEAMVSRIYQRSKAIEVNGKDLRMS